MADTMRIVITTTRGVDGAYLFQGLTQTRRFLLWRTVGATPLRSDMTETLADIARCATKAVERATGRRLNRTERKRQAKTLAKGWMAINDR